MAAATFSSMILLVWNAALWVKLDEHVGRYTVSALLRDVRCGAVWVVTSVYGPNRSSDSNAFPGELHQVAGLWRHPWVIGGDFNVIRFSNEKKKKWRLFYYYSYEGVR